MTRAELLALAERVEKAQGADRGLDAAVFLACGPHAIPWRHAEGGNLYSGGLGTTAPAYTASLDAAASLVPEGCSWGIVSDFFHSGKPAAKVGKSRSEASENPWHSAATPALALTAAALRARAEEASDE